MVIAPTSIMASPIIPIEHLVDLDKLNLARYVVRKSIDERNLIR